MSDDAARFFRELRQLRNGAGLGHAELAARAHYPYDTIRDAEVGPSLPDLPVLSAFVRGCGGTTEEWEERWRSLNKTPSLPLATARQAGHSDAADAGARLGATTPAGDAPDPSIIMAALNRVAEEMSVSHTDLPTRSAPSGASPAPFSTRPAPADPSPAPFSPWDKPAPDSSSGNWGEPGRSAWDPIRLSSAWPVLKEDAALLPDPSASPTPTARAPWDTAPWAEDPAAPSAAAPSFPDLTPETPTVWTSAGTTAAMPPTAHSAPSRPTTSVSAPSVPVASTVSTSSASTSSVSASTASTRTRTGGHARVAAEGKRSSSLIAFVVAIVAVLILIVVLYVAFG